MDASVSFLRARRVERVTECPYIISSNSAERVRRAKTVSPVQSPSWRFSLPRHARCHLATRNPLGRLPLVIPDKFRGKPGAFATGWRQPIFRLRRESRSIADNRHSRNRPGGAAKIHHMLGRYQSHLRPCPFSMVVFYWNNSFHACKLARIRCLQPQQRPMPQCQSNRGRSCPNWSPSLRRVPAAFSQRPARTSNRTGPRQLRHVREIPRSLVEIEGVSPSPRLALPAFPAARQAHSRHLQHCGIPQDRVGFQSCLVFCEMRSEGAVIWEARFQEHLSAARAGRQSEPNGARRFAVWLKFAGRHSEFPHRRSNGRTDRTWTTTGFSAISFSAQER